MTNPAEYITGRTVQEQMNELISYVDTRAAEVATSAIASDVADVQQAKTDAEAARDAAILAKDTAVATVSDCVKMTPSGVQTITGYGLTVSQGVTVPTEATGTFSTKAANSTKVKNELDAYSPMVRTTGNQTVAGVKTFSSSLIQTGSASPTIKPGNDDKSVVPGSNLTHNMVLVQDDAANNLAGIFSTTGADGKRHITAYVFDCDGTYRSQVLI